MCCSIKCTFTFLFNCCSTVISRINASQLSGNLTGANIPPSKNVTKERRFFSTMAYEYFARRGGAVRVPLGED